MSNKHKMTKSFCSNDIHNDDESNNVVDNDIMLNDNVVNIIDPNQHVIKKSKVHQNQNKNNNKDDNNSHHQYQSNNDNVVRHELYGEHNTDDNSILPSLKVSLTHSITQSTTTTAPINNISHDNHSADNDNNNDIIILDGSIGEGGGQMIRNAITYGILLHKEFRMIHIRMGRTKPGLSAQHVIAIQLALSISNFNLNNRNSHGVVHGNHLQSTEIHYIPPSSSIKTSIVKKDDGSMPIPSIQQHPEKRQEMNVNISSSNEINNNIKGDTTTMTKQVRSITGDTKTAGSIVLLLQTAIPCSLLLSSLSDQETSSFIELNLIGGTNATLAPPYDYWEKVFLPTIMKHCFSGSKLSNQHIIQPKVLRRGYYPKGGGHVQVLVEPLSNSNMMRINDEQKKNGSLLLPIQLTERGDICHIYIRTYHAGHLPRHLAQNMANDAKRYFQQKFSNSNTSSKKKHSLSSSSHDTNTIVYQLDIVTETNCIGSSFGILIVATTTTGCLVGGSSVSDNSNKKKKMKTANEITIDACNELYTNAQEMGCVDEWLQDQLILYMALANGISNVITGSLTLHTQTAIYIAQCMLPNVKFTITPLTDETIVLNQEKQQHQMNIMNFIHPTMGTNNNISYGKNGRINGRHLIQCYGIGYSPSSTTTTYTSISGLK